jgi:hypothetical protein
LPHRINARCASFHIRYCRKLWSLYASTALGRQNIRYRRFESQSGKNICSVFSLLASLRERGKATSSELSYRLNHKLSHWRTLHIPDFYGTVISITMVIMTTFKAKATQESFKQCPEILCLDIYRTEALWRQHYLKSKTTSSTEYIFNGKITSVKKCNKSGILSATWRVTLRYYCEQRTEKNVEGTALHLFWNSTPESVSTDWGNPLNSQSKETSSEKKIESGSFQTRTTPRLLARQIAFQIQSPRCVYFIRK